MQQKVLVEAPGQDNKAEREKELTRGLSLLACDGRKKACLLLLSLQPLSLDLLPPPLQCCLILLIQVLLASTPRLVAPMKQKRKIVFFCT